MANDLNVVAIVGRLVREAEVKYTSSGAAMVRFSIAVNRNRRMNDGSWNEEPSYFDCLYAGKSAENVSQYLEKGRQVSISGELRQNRWEQDGQYRSRVEIVVSQLNFLGSRSDNAANGNGGFSDGSDYQHREPQQSSRPAGNGSNYAPANQNRYSGSFSRPSQQENFSNDYSVGGPESYGDDDVPF